MKFDDGRGNGGETPEFNALLDTSMEELRVKTMGHQAGWGLGKANRWSLDQSRGELFFTFEDGSIATCPAQIVGSFDGSEGSWLWAWANPSIADSRKRDSLRVRDYGEQRHITRLHPFIAAAQGVSGQLLELKLDDSTRTYRSWRN
jgi:hypothetical protein